MIEVELLTTETEGTFLNDTGAPQLHCRIANSLPLSVLIDTGASCAMISKSFADSIAPADSFPRTLIHQCKITFADGRSELSHSQVLLPVHLIRRGCRESLMIPFLIIPSLRRDVLFGRNALSTIGIRLQFGTPTAPPDDHVDKLPDVEINDISNEHDLFIPDEDHFTETILHSLPTLSDSTMERLVKTKLLDSSPPYPRCSTLDEVTDTLINQHANHALELLAAEGWLEFANQYYIRLLRIDPDDSDTPNQIWAFQIRWTLTSSEPSRQAWNSQRLISDLSPTHSVEWKKHIGGFTDRNWWRHHPGRSDLTSTIFPVIGKDCKTTTCRPCCDMRVVNSVSPPVSATTNSVSDSVLRLRSLLKPDSTILQFDLSKAFYKIRVDILDQNFNPFQLILKVGNDNYTSDRLVFGLSCGPAALNATQLLTSLLF